MKRESNKTYTFPLRITGKLYNKIEVVKAEVFNFVYKNGSKFEKGITTYQGGKKVEEEAFNVVFSDVGKYEFVYFTQKIDYVSNKSKYVQNTNSRRNSI